MSVSKELPDVAENVDVKPEKKPFAKRHPILSRVFIFFVWLSQITFLCGIDSIRQFDFPIILGFILFFCSLIYVPLFFVDRLFAVYSKIIPGEKKKGEKIRTVRHLCDASLFAFGYIVVFILVLAVWGIVLSHFPIVTISEKTTYLVEPLNAKGEIDYAAEIENRFYPPIAPEKNGFRKLASALGPDCMENFSTRPVFWPKLCEKLNLYPRLKPTHVFRPAEGWISNGCFIANSRLWTYGEFPELAIHLEKNAPILDVLEEAVRCEDFFIPPLLNESSDGESDSRRYPFHETSYRPLRDMASLLRCRVALRLSDGDYTAARKDVETLYRLARAIRSRPGSPYSLFVGMQLEQAANESAILWIETVSPNESELLEFAKWRKNLSGPIAKSDFVLWQRLNSLNYLQGIVDKQVTVNNEQDVEGFARLGCFFFRLAPWNRAFRSLNQKYDDFAERIDNSGSLGLPSINKLLVPYESAWPQRKENVYVIIVRVGIFGIGPWMATTEWFDNDGQFVDFFSYQWYATTFADDLCAETAIALRIYRLRHCSPPEKLEDLLAEGLLDEIPIDPFGKGEPIRFAFDSGECRVYSVGMDGKDDGGKNFYKDDLPPRSGADDIRIKLRDARP